MRDNPIAGRGDGVVWKTMVPPHPGIPSLDGHTDTVPDIVGRLGAPIDLAIFTEGNHFPALLGGEIIEPFRVWASAQPQNAGLELGNIVVVTLPQPMIVGMLLSGGIAFGNLTLELSRASGFYPDIVMGGAAPLTQLHTASIVESEARMFARNRGLSLMVAAGNPLAIQGLADLARPGIRVVMASASEPGARRQYIDAIDGLIGEEAARSILSREIEAFPGRPVSSTVMCCRRSSAATPMSGSSSTISRGISRRRIRSSAPWSACRGPKNTLRRSRWSRQPSRCARKRPKRFRNSFGSRSRGLSAIWVRGDQPGRVWRPGQARLTVPSGRRAAISISLILAYFSPVVAARRRASRGSRR